MNNVCLAGNLCKEWDVSAVAGGKIVGKNTIAIRKSKDESVFIPIRAWAGTAELLANYTVKGDRIAVSGYLDVYEYTDKGERKYYTYVTIDNVTFMSKR